MTGIKRHHLWLLPIGIILISCGLYVLFNPMAALLTSALFIGFSFILMGFGYCLEYRFRRSFLYMVIGVLDILIGMIFLTNLGLSALSMPAIFGFWCLFMGISQLISGWHLRQQYPSFAYLTLAIGLAGLIFGTLIFLYPVFGMVTLTFMLGSYLLISGFYELVRYFRGELPVRA